MLKKIIIIAILGCITLNAYAKDQKGVLLGGELNGALVMPEVNFFGASSSTASNTWLIGASITGEYDFLDYLGAGFGLGLKYYKIKATANSSTSVRYNLLASNIPVTLRFRPMPLISKESDFTFFVGTGLDIQMILSSQRTAPSTLNNILDSNIGLIAEVGAGYYITDTILLQGSLKYIRGFLDLDTLSGDKITPHFLELTMGLLFKL